MRVTSKGQVTIPKWVRERFGIRPGSDVRFRELNHRVVLERSTAGVHPFDLFYGFLKRSQSSDELLRRLRGA